MIHGGRIPAGLLVLATAALPVIAAGMPTAMVFRFPADDSRAAATTERPTSTTSPRETQKSIAPAQTLSDRMLTKVRKGAGAGDLPPLPPPLPFEMPPVPGSYQTDVKIVAPRPKKDERANTGPARADIAPRPQESGAAAKADPADKAAATPPTESNDGEWVVQVASFIDQADAENAAHTLSGDFAAYYIRSPQDGETRYRVRVGPMVSQSMANHVADELRARGHDTWVTHVNELNACLQGRCPASGQIVDKTKSAKMLLLDLYQWADAAPAQHNGAP